MYALVLFVHTGLCTQDCAHTQDCVSFYQIVISDVSQDLASRDLTQVTRDSRTTAATCRWLQTSVLRVCLALLGCLMGVPCSVSSLYAQAGFRPAPPKTHHKAPAKAYNHMYARHMRGIYGSLSLCINVKTCVIL